MNPIDRPLPYRLIVRIVKRFTPHYTLLGTENLPEGPCIIVGNHAHAYGPIAAELYIPGPHYTWCAGEMMTRETVAEYAYRDFWSGKPAAVRPVYRLLSRLIPPLAVYIFGNAHTIAVHRDLRLITTFRQSAARLREGCRIVIFPECYAPHNNIVNGFQDRFVDLARCCVKAGLPAPVFVPMYLAPRLGVMSFGRPVRYDPDAAPDEERRRICGELMDGITACAAALPRHVVIPYDNSIPKRLYPKSLPVRVSEK